MQNEENDHRKVGRGGPWSSRFKSNSNIMERRGIGEDAPVAFSFSLPLKFLEGGQGNFFPKKFPSFSSFSPPYLQPSAP